MMGNATGMTTVENSSTRNKVAHPPRNTHQDGAKNTHAHQTPALH